MKHQIIAIFLLSFLFWGCESTGVNITSENIAKTGVISGRVTYQEILTDQVIQQNSDIIVEIYATYDQVIPRKVDKILTGSTFEFAALPFGTYHINLSLEDSTTGILYKSQLRSLKLSHRRESLNKDAELIPMDQTVIIASVTTPDDRPVPNATVFLYNDITFLENYQGTGGFVDSGVTNRLGKAAFVNHAPGDYYLYTELVIEEDTLTSNVIDLAPQSVSANTLNELKVKLEF